MRDVQYEIDAQQSSLDALISQLENQDVAIQEQLGNTIQNSSLSLSIAIIQIANKADEIIADEKLSESFIEDVYYEVKNTMNSLNTALENLMETFIYHFTLDIGNKEWVIMLFNNQIVHICFSNYRSKYYTYMLLHISKNYPFNCK